MNYIKQNRLLDGTVYTISYLSLNDLEKIINLQNNVIKKLDDNMFLQPLNLNEYKHILNGNGFIIGAFHQSRLIAMRALLKPEIDEDHLGLEAGLKLTQLHKVVYQEISLVDPKYRDNRLQQILGNVIMDQLENETDKHEFVCATVSPFNIPSLLDKFRQKMIITSLKQIYDDKWRYVFFKQINVKDIKWNIIEKVLMSNYEKQIKLLHDGWHGYSLEKYHDDYYVLFGKRL